MRVMAVDWGEKRLGIAVSDPLNMTAQPLAVLPNVRPEKAVADLQKLVRQHEIGTIVIGIPFETSGKEGAKALKVRNWISQMKECFDGIEFHEMDERFTTMQAQQILREGGVRGEKQKESVDMIAAALILEQYLRSASR